MISLNMVEGAVAVLTMSRGSVNPLSGEMVEAIRDAVDGLRDSADARALVIRSDQKHFCAGADLKERAGMTDEETMDFINRIGECFLTISALPFPTIALIHGAALGGGLELALSCDFRLCAEGSELGFPEVSLGIIPGAGGTQRLPRLIGLSRAKEMIFSAESVSAQTALGYGLVDDIYGSSELYDRGLELAKRFVPISPQALRSAKAAIDPDIDAGLEHERECYRAVLSSPERAESLKKFSSKGRN